MLKLPDAFYKSLKTFEFALDSVITIDKTSKVIGWNKQAESCFGWRKEEALDKSITDFIIPHEFRKAHEQGMQHFLETGDGPILNKRIEVKALRSNGDLFDAELSVVPTQVEGHLIFHGFIRDTSLSKKAERRVQLQQDILSLLVRPNPSIFINKILEIVSLNQGFQFATFWKYDKLSNTISAIDYSYCESIKLEKLHEGSKAYTFQKGEGGPGRAWSEQAPLWLPKIENDPNFPREKMVREFGIEGGVWLPVFSGENFYGVFEFLTLKELPLDDDFQLMILSLGNLIGQGFERERAVKQLAQEKRQTQFLSEISIKSTESSKDNFLRDILLDLTRLAPELKVADWCTIRLVDGVLENQNVIVAHNNKEKKELAEQIASHFKSSMDQGSQLIIQTGQSQIQSIIDKKEIQKVAESKNLSEFFEKVNFQSWIGAPIKTADEVFGAISFLSSEVPVRYFDQEDLKFLEEVGRRIALVIKQYQNQQKLEKAKVVAQKANNAKSVFLANVSHEIRTPLGAILGFTDILESDEELTQTQLEWLKKIKDNGDHLLNLINDILDLSKVENENFKLNLKETSIRDIFQEVSDTILSLIGNRNIKFSCEFTSPVPEIVYSDKTKVKQVLMNILGNAVKFTSSGSIKVKVGFSMEKKKFNVLILDTGRGINHKDFSKIFKPFEQVDSSEQDPMPGTGLGLPLSKAIAQKFNGNVNILSSVPNKETVFEFSFEATPHKDTQYLKEFIQESGSSSRRNIQSQSLEKRKILLVDDTKDNLVYISMFLKSAGAIVDTASSGKEAIKKLAQGSYDVTLMDVQMPDMNGLEATRRLRAKGHKSPIIALTAHSSKEDIEKSLKAGCNLHLSKPVERESLISSIVSLL